MNRISAKSVFISIFFIILVVVIFGDEDCDICYSGSVMAFKFLIAALILVAASFYFFYKWYNTNSMIYKIERQPISKINMIGEDTPTSFYGDIKEDEPLLTSPFTNTKCVFYHYIKEKYVRSGDSSYWKVVENKSNHVKFHVDDGTGTIHVSLRNIDSDLGKFALNKKNTNSYLDYSNSEVDALKMAYQTYGEGKTWLGFQDKSVRYNEYVLTPGENIFVYGWAYPEGNEKMVAENKDCPLIISRKTKEAYIEDFSIGDSFFYTNNLFLYIGAIMAYFSLSYLYGIGLWFLALLLSIISIKMVIQVYNRMIELRNRISNSKAQIDIELKKRHELIPQLQSVTASYSKYESSLIKIRNLLINDFNVDNGLNKYYENQKKLNQLILLVEKYPELKANLNYKNFVDCMSQIEENIAYYRGFYSKSVLKYNNLIQIFPFNIIALFSGFKKENYWSDVENKKSDQKHLNTQISQISYGAFKT